MIYEIQGHIKTDNNGIRTAVSAILPAVDDPKFHDGLGADYRYIDTVDEESGIKVIIFRYVYTLEVDRENLLSSLKGLAGVINGCEAGSFIKPIGCNHDTNPPTRCEVQVGGVNI